MAKISPEFMRACQGEGWNVITADDQFVWLGCARAGCNFQFKVREGAAIPATCRPQPVLAEIPIEQFDDMRAALRLRREQLCLSIKDVEDAAGLATDHLAKFEKDDFSKIPNIQTAMDWAQALGYTLVLRQTGMPQVTLGLISRTRHLIEKRLRSIRYFRGERERRKG